jgi:hypothetical protein
VLDRQAGVEDALDGAAGEAEAEHDDELENAVLSIDPHETSVGLPRPRNVSVAWSRIAPATVSVAETRISGVTFGSTWRAMIWVFPAPRARARSMNGRASTASVCARSSRAVLAHDVTAIAIVIEVSPSPMTADSAIASGRLGSTMNQSVSVISNRPTIP